MPLFIDAYLADTTHFSAEEHGAYMLLLMAMWRRNGWVPDDDHDLARVCCVNVRRWPRVKKRLIPLLIQKDGELSQKRLKRVFVELRKRNAQKRSSDRPSETKQNNGLSTAASRTTRVTRARDLKPSPDISPSGDIARKRARGPPQDLSSYLMNELRQMQQENGHDQSAINGNNRRLAAGDRPAEDAGSDPPGQAADAKPQ
jgi:uncharacterized protein YdaU (DUF1376 family)